MGMGDLNAERNALAANIALCHHCTSLPLKVVRRLKTPTIIIAELPEKCKHFFPVSAKNFRSAEWPRRNARHARFPHRLTLIFLRRRPSAGS